MSPRIAKCFNLFNIPGGQACFLLVQDQGHDAMSRVAETTIMPCYEKSKPFNTKQISVNYCVVKLDKYNIRQMQSVHVYSLLLQCK